MADIKISELTQVSALNNGDLVEVSQVNALAPSGYTSLKASMTDLGEKVNTDIEYTTDLADFTDKTTLGAIKETAKGKNIADEYDDTQTYNKGDVVIYKNTLYICTTNNTTGTWDASKWTATTVQSLIGDLTTLTTTDKSSIVGAVNEIASYTPVYGNTSSGAIATFDTSLALPLQDLQIEINAVQESGTPTPSSPKAISGFTGANIVNISGEDNDLVTYIRNIYLGTYGFVDLGSLSWNYNSSLAYFYATLSDMKQATQADELLNWVQNKYTQIGARFNVDWGSAPDKSIGTRQTTSYLCVKDSAYTDTTAFTNAMSGVYLLYELDTPTTPSITSAQLSAICNSFDVIDNVTAISWNDEAGTVYGGALDVTSGVLTVTHKIIDMGSLTWNTVGMGGGRTGFKSTISDIELAPAATVVFNGKCECYQSLNGNDVYLGNTGIATWGSNTHDIAVYDPDRESLSGADFKTSVTGSDLVYTLQTPVTYQLTPTQISAIVGTNNIFTDTNGDTSVVYACSLKDYIDSQ